LKYVRVVKWSTEGDSIRLEMLGEDQEIHSFEVGTDCAGVLAAALTAELEKSDGQGNERQFIRPTGMQTGKTAQNEPMLFMVLDGGTELPLVFPPEALSVLISELEGLQAILQPGSQVRWQ
jgi:hypothetical protein